METTSESDIAFELGAKSIFESWTTVLMAVEHQFGGPNSAEKVRKIYEDLMDLFYDRKENLDYIYVAEYLEDALVEDLHLQFAEGDPELRQIGMLLTRLYNECKSGNFGPLNDLLQKNATKSPQDILWGGMKVTEYPPKDEPPQLIPAPNTVQPSPVVNIHFTQDQNLTSPDSDGVSEMEVDEESKAEGWTVVTKGRRKR